MRILGFDFTSAPNPRKPITCAVGEFVAGVLRIEEVQRLPTFIAFEHALMQYPSYIAGFDFPFSQPRRLIQNLAWPTDWASLINHISALGKQTFESQLRHYIAHQPIGDKLHLRHTDSRVNALSPMRLDYIPVGKMFFQGAPRLLAAGLNILPCHPTTESRVALEVYPALVNRRLNQKRPYKQDAAPFHTGQHTAARTDLLTALYTPEFAQTYGFTLYLDQTVSAAALTDNSGDTLDAVLCAVQTAWASLTPDFSIPADCDSLEGWIIDPLGRHDPCIHCTVF